MVDIGRVTIHEDVILAVTFIHGKVFPRVMRLGSRQVEIATVVQEWTGSHQRTRFFYQLVEDHAGRRYKLCCNLSTLNWMVEEL